MTMPHSAGLEHSRAQLRKEQAKLRVARVRIAVAILGSLALLGGLFLLTRYGIHRLETVAAEVENQTIQDSWRREIAWSSALIPDPVECDRGQQQSGSQPEACSSDGRFEAYTKGGLGFWHTLYVRDRISRAETAIVSIQEHDPWSGRSFRFRFTTDSRGLIIIGRGPIRGFRGDLPLVYDLASRTLSSAKEDQCEFDQVAWKSGNLVMRGDQVQCLGVRSIWFTWYEERLVDRFGPPDEDSGRAMTWQFELGERANLYRGVYLLEVSIETFAQKRRAEMTHIRRVRDAA